MGQRAVQGTEYRRGIEGRTGDREPFRRQRGPSAEKETEGR
jgi:hypothetical protein